MYDKALILFCVAVAAFGHGVDVTTPFPVTTVFSEHSHGPVITSYSSPAEQTSSISNTYLPSPEVKIGSNYQKHSNAYSVGSTYVPVHSSHSSFKPVGSNTFGHSLNLYSTTQATPTYITSTPAYSSVPNFNSRSSFVKSYPISASYVKSTIAPSYSYSVKPVNNIVSYASPVHTYAQPVSKTYSHTYSQPISYYQPTVTPAPYTVNYAGYSPYPTPSNAYLPSSTPAPSFTTSTVAYGSSTPFSYTVSPTVASYSTPSSYSIQPAPLKAQFSYVAPASHSYSNQGGYSGSHYVQNVGYPYHGTHGAVPLVAESHYPSYSTGHSGTFAYNSVPVSHGNSVHGSNYNW